MRTPAEPSRLHDDFADLSTEAVQNWAQSARLRAQQLCDQAEAQQHRASALWVELGLGAADRTDSRLRRRLQLAELQIAHLEKALASNRRIGMAIGILMARHGLTEDQAFAALRLLSNRRNVKLHVLAEQIIYAGEP
ncbi:ANTAR domain-containing protein [Petropleomorpha daqingensis]|uniref:ANTAR domain-containing protein n=1 Tax=Petropleomorpha daqingensis TaxID=2026353 RepID=A0A853CL44_9ACTN|nr:ANTAR domain-containing protein [Petropleomorpha daqingensis]NYJ06693.1 hypothetical protein [Petropleomorpha daqingensis]